MVRNLERLALVLGSVRVLGPHEWTEEETRKLILELEGVPPVGRYVVGLRRVFPNSYTKHIRDKVASFLRTRRLGRRDEVGKVVNDDVVRVEVGPEIVEGGGYSCRGGPGAAREWNVDPRDFWLGEGSTHELAIELRAELSSNRLAVPPAEAIWGVYSALWGSPGSCVFDHPPIAALGLVDPISSKEIAARI